MLCSWTRSALKKRHGHRSVLVAKSSLVVAHRYQSSVPTDGSASTAAEHSYDATMTLSDFLTEVESDMKALGSDPHPDVRCVSILWEKGRKKVLVLL